MEKQELIEKLKGHGAWCTECHDINGEKDRYVKVAKVRELLEQLDEPQKVTVPKFVAEWFEKHKHRLGYSIWKLVGESHKSYTTNKLDMRHWILQEPNNPIETLIHMKDGYEVEEEPKYQVKLKFGRQYLSKNADGNMLDFYSCMVFPPSFSKKELESIEDGAFYKADGDKEWINPIIELVPVEKV
ncbi:DUF1642 domain-containing protein [Enterococcus avium]|uniref:DUF1642 domain-containing protein n=1 Tax=Enterococcus avium TaxID=33945 RepID=UPI0032E390AB